MSSLRRSLTKMNEISRLLLLDYVVVLLNPGSFEWVPGNPLHPAQHLLNGDHDIVIGVLVEDDRPGDQHDDDKRSSAETENGVEL